MSAPTVVWVWCVSSYCASNSAGRTERHRLPVAQQLRPHFAQAIHAAVALLHALHLLAQDVVAQDVVALRSSAARRSASPLVGPGRAPESCSAFSNQRRSVSFVQPNFGAIAEMAAHWDGWCGNCSRTNRTARSRTSGLNRGARDFAMAPSAHNGEPPGIPGRFRPHLVRAMQVRESPDWTAYDTVRTG